jgi:hypothetical protein
LFRKNKGVRKKLEMNTGLAPIDKISSTQMGHNLKVNDYFEVSCRSKIDHIEVSFHSAVRR